MFYSAENLLGFGDKPCLIHNGNETSYAGLAAAAARFARRFPARRGLVAIEMAAEPTAIAAYLGALQAGHAVIPLPTDAPEIAQKLMMRFRPAASWRRIGGRSRLLFHEAPAPLHPDLTLLLQTSGSTGQGRGVRLSYAAVEANAQAIAEYLEIGAQDRAALVLPLHYSYGLSVLHSHLARGASLWLAGGSILDLGFPSELAASGATSLSGVPHHFRMLARSEPTDALPDCLRCLTVAGGAMNATQVRHWTQVMEARSGRFFVMYGQTEATARIAFLPPDHAAKAPDAVGQAIPGGTLLLRDASGQEVDGQGSEGELIYRGPNVMMGYAETSTDLALGPQLSELATGDLARCGADGFYRIVGRLSRMSKIAGLRIGHDAMEQALAEMGHDVAVWGNDEKIWIAARDTSQALAVKAAHLAGLGAQHVVTVPCTSFPRHANGKIDYTALKQLAVPPPPEPNVQALFARTFAPHPIGPRDSFESLGGDSLQHVELSLALDRHLSGLPNQWEQLAIAELRPTATDGMNRISMPMLMRATAILAVVIAHQTLWPIYGGAAAMVILLGMSIALHRRQALINGEAMRFLHPVLRVLGPYGLVLAAYTLVWQQLPWASVFLIGNFAVTTPETHLMLPYLYWFVEAYVQISLLLLMLFRSRRMRDWLHASPFGIGLALLGIGVILRLTLPEIWPLPAGRSQFSVPWVFYLFALGWCIAVAKSARQRVLVLAAAAIILPIAAWLGGNWHGSWIKYLSLLGIVGLLLNVQSVALPRMAVRGFMHLAQAAFPIYLLHRLVPEVLMPLLDFALPTPVADAVAILGGIGLGLLAARGLSTVARLRGCLRRSPQGWRLGLVGKGL